MSADAKEVERLLDEHGISHGITDSGHEVFWTDSHGRRWSYFSRLYSGRDSRLTLYDVSPEDAMRIACGEDRA